MRKLTQWSRLAALAAVVGTGCKSLEVVNPNAPDAARAFSDPGAVGGLVTGAMRNWVQLRTDYDGALVLTAMADSYSASWNNFNLRFYTSYGVECPDRCGWANTPSSPFRFQIETYWYGFYGILSSVNDVLTAIRSNHVVITNTATTKMMEAVSVMLQGVVFANISLNYDKGFAFDENVQRDPNGLPIVDFVSRAIVRDSAIAKFNEAIALMTATPFSASLSTWLGAPGPQYSSADLIKVMRTMQAEVLAYHARNAAEDATTNWAQVATFASQGISSGTPKSLEYADDNVNMNDGLLEWGNAIFTMRTDTRLAHVITNGPDPAKIHRTPWVGQDPPPNAFDHRVGDGTWGPEDDFSGCGTIAQDAGAGTDFAYCSENFLNPARGTFHFSNLVHVRYSYAASVGSGLPGEDGTGSVPVYIPAQNDLLWAEGLVRGGGSTALAAAKINNTRVTRGHLSTLTGAEGTAALLAAIRYENDIELLGTGPSPFYNRRRETPEGWTTAQACPGNICLWQGTPRQEPVPAKDLLILRQELYSFGGPGAPDVSSPSFVAGEPVWSVRRIADALRKSELEQARGRHRF